jgi:hypothetical protein
MVLEIKPMNIKIINRKAKNDRQTPSTIPVFPGIVEKNGEKGVFNNIIQTFRIDSGSLLTVWFGVLKTGKRGGFWTYLFPCS